MKEIERTLHCLFKSRRYCVNLTQWSCHFTMMTAGPKERAGFILAPVYGIWNANKLVWLEKCKCVPKIKICTLFFAHVQMYKCTIHTIHFSFVLILTMAIKTHQILFYFILHCTNYDYRIMHYHAVPGLRKTMLWPQNTVH